jgi:hypothetical protein
MNAEQIMEGLKKLFAPKATGAHWLDNKLRATPRTPETQNGYWSGPVHHPYYPGVLDDLETLETAEETWLMAVAPHLIHQRRLGVKHSFAAQATYTSPQRIELGLVLFADGNAKNLYGQRAILEQRVHIGREVWIVQKRLDGLNHDFVSGSEQKRICTRHGLCWIELDAPIDTENRSYPAVLF